MGNYFIGTSHGVQPHVLLQGRVLVEVYYEASDNASWPSAGACREAISKSIWLLSLYTGYMRLSSSLSPPVSLCLRSGSRVHFGSPFPFPFPSLISSGVDHYSPIHLYLTTLSSIPVWLRQPGSNRVVWHRVRTKLETLVLTCSMDIQSGGMKRSGEETLPMNSSQTA